MSSRKGSCKRLFCSVLAAATLFSTGGYAVGLLEPTRLMAASSDKVELKIKEITVNTKIDLTSADVVVNGENVEKWMLYHPGDTEAEYEGADIEDITSFTPKKPGYIWIRAKLPEENTAYFKIAVKADENTPAPVEYTAVPAKENLKPLKAPIQLGYFRTWHDYWSWVPEDSSSKLSDAPAEVDVLAVFHAFTEEGNPFWEKLKMEYVPKLNKQGTRVIRTIGLDGIDGRSAISKRMNYTKDEAGYKALAAAIVKEYVTDHNLDGLDIDFEYHDISRMKLANVIQAKAVIEEISKIIGPKNPNRPSNMLFILDTNKEADDPDGIFMATKDCYDYVIRQNYQRDTFWYGYDSYEGVLPKEKYLTGFSFYEEHDPNQWNNVPSTDLIADRDTNETFLTNPDDLLYMEDFYNSEAYKQAYYAATEGYGGIFSYAVERDGVAHGNDKKFFRNKEGGKPSQYLITKALKHYMKYESAKSVEDIKLGVNEFQVGSTLELNADVAPANTVEDKITWSIVNDAKKTTAKDAVLTDGNKLTAVGEGKITLKAVVKGGIKSKNFMQYEDFEKEYEIKVTKAHKPQIISPSYPVIPVAPEKKEEGGKEEQKPETKQEDNSPLVTEITDTQTPQGQGVVKKVLTLPSLKKIDLKNLKGLTESIEKIILPQKKAKVDATLTKTALSELLSKKIKTVEVKGKNFSVYLSAKNIKTLNKLVKKQVIFKANKPKTGKIRLQIVVDGKKLTSKQSAKLKIKVK